MGTASFAGLSSVPASASGGNGQGNDGQATADISVLPNPNFITNARGGTPPFDDDPDTPLFDPGPVSVPLNEILESAEEYDAELSRSLNDGKHQVVKPPERYDREAGYDDAWKPITWGEYSEVDGHLSVGGTKPDSGNGGGDGNGSVNSNGDGNGGGDETGTRVNSNVQDGIPNGQYAVWVVKFAALAEDSDLGPDDPFVTPGGNGLVGFHNLGQKFDEEGKSENDFTVDEHGAGGIHVFTGGGKLSGVPGFRPLEGEDIADPVEDGPVPFVGEPDDYEQPNEDLIRIDSDLREEDERHFVGAYHYDDQTWGVYPGPWHVTHFSAVFRF